MGFQTLVAQGYGGSHLNDYLPKILAELQGFTVSGPLTGAAANTFIAVPEGIDTQDTIVKALQFTAGVPSDITSTVTIASELATGTMTLAAGVVAGDVVSVNGKAYTAVAGVPSPSNPIVGSRQFVDGVAIMALGTTQAQYNSLMALLGCNKTTAAALVTGGSNYIAAASLAQAVNAADNAIVAVPLTAAGAVSNIVTYNFRLESTVGNAVALSVAASNGHVTDSGSTLTGGAYGTQKGTVTLAGALAGDTVVVDGVTFTAVASSNVTSTATCTFTGSSASVTATNTFAAGNTVMFSAAAGAVMPTGLVAGLVYYVIATGLSGAAFQVSNVLNGAAIVVGTAGSGTLSVSLVSTAIPGKPLDSNQFIGGVVTVQDLMNMGFTYAVSLAILAVSNDAAAATILTNQINNTDGSRVTASNGFNIAQQVGDDETTFLNNAESLNLVTLLQAASATNVITIVADFDNSAALIALTSTNGVREALSGATLTAGTRGIKSTTNTTGNLVLLFWFKKSRIQTQW